VAAQDFTFTANGKDGVSAWVKFNGRNVGATSSTVSSTSIGPDGQAQTTNGICQSWTLEPASGRSFETVCNYTSDRGAYSTISWCPKNSTTDCSGKLVGVSGVYLHKTGTFSVHSKEDADGNDRYSGSGHWN
jgi:hypothetical protein